MNFYEYHAHAEVDVNGMLTLLERMGWKGVCFVSKSLEETAALRSQFASMPSKPPLDVSFGLKIETSHPDQMQKLARKARKAVEVILVHGGNIEVNRAACETPEIDVLAHPELGRNDGGIDMVMAKLAKKNHVAIEFNMRNVLISNRKTRADVFASMLENAKLVRKYKPPFVLTSGAVDPYDLRAPSELLSFARLLGLNPKYAKAALSSKMLHDNRKRLGGKWIMPGVEVE
jgi:ribonuclease P/MRP protein subunit RPP1